MRCFCKMEMNKIIIDKQEYYLCPSCGYLKKVNILNAKEEKERYDKHICDSGYLEYMRRVYNSLRPYLRDGATIDFGCGKIHALANIMNEDNRHCDYYDLYYYNNMPNSKYDNIILIEVFEHIEDIYALLEDLKGRLNNKGRIIIMTKPKSKELSGWWYLRDSTHISFIEPKTMEVLGSLLGLEVEIDKFNDIFILTKNN